MKFDRSDTKNMVFAPVEHDGVVGAQFRCHQRVRRQKLHRTCTFQIFRMSRLEDRISGFFPEKNKKRGEKVYKIFFGKLGFVSQKALCVDQIF